MEPDRVDTPLMRQYWEIKKEHRDAILLFRLGDFYEMFFDDAEVASRILDIALTSRDKNSENPVPLCGVPHHAVSGYISKLLESGHKVAICDQMEDPKFAKGIVKREVVRVITPGLRTDLEGLSATERNALVSLYATATGVALGWVDVASGDFRVTTFPDVFSAENEIDRLNPSEILLPEGDGGKPFESWVSIFSISYPSVHFERIPNWVYDRAEKKLSERFAVATLDGFGIEDIPLTAPPLAALLHYVEERNHTPLPHLTPPKPYSVDRFVHLDPSTRDHLEIFRSLGRPGDERTLFGILNETRTSMGTRKLKDWLHFPLRDVPAIRKRLEVVAELSENAQEREAIRTQLSGVYDLERLIGRIASARANPRDLVSLVGTLRAVEMIRPLVSQSQTENLHLLLPVLDPHSDLVSWLEKGLSDQPPITLSEGGSIRDGFDPRLDDLRYIKRKGKQWIAELEAKERQRTGIGSLRVGYNRVFGYYIEATNANLAKVPADYQRKQTLTNGERFVTPELKEEEAKILGAEEKIAALEQEIFEGLRQKVVESMRSIQRLADALAEIDVYASLSRAAVRNRYVRPEVDESDRIEIRAGRHPVVERFIGEPPFVPNDTLLDCDDRQLIILTGPNMAGKSTIMRQVALIVLLAQIGSFVPAEEARIGVVDRIFTRVGASDDLSRGRSTFMVEMSETANILRNATKRSLILLDEIGRGTSTFDGLSIAWAVAEEIHDRIGAKTIFATHYHELTDLARTKARVRNMNVTVREWGEQILFLRTLAEGAVNRSYGIAVAKLAGVFPSVTDRAREILANLERSELDATGSPVLARRESAVPAQTAQLELFRRMADDLWEELKRIDPDKMTPKEAHDLLFAWRQRYHKA
ncbi:MAG: DNA mismatch repair protein MutS [Pseudomonadota bacterium]